MTRPPGLRDTPRLDRSTVGMHWTTEWRYQVVDLFCGRGGVGNALAGGGAPLDPWTFAGFDIEDYSDTYPGEFYQRDLLSDPDVRDLSQDTSCPTQGLGGRRVPPDAVSDSFGLPTLQGLTADVVWVSFPCIAYSSLTPCNYNEADDPQQAALEDNPRITDEFRDFLTDIAPHYVIENVPRATQLGDLDANVRVNGLAFKGPDADPEEKFDVTRHFETTFPVPDAYRDPLPEEECVTIDTREDQSVSSLANAKDVPETWGRQGVHSAIPSEYVAWILHHCPSVPSPAPQRVEQLLAPTMQNGLGVECEAL